MSIFRSKVPSKSRSLRELRKVYPGAEILPCRENGADGVQLSYEHSYKAPDGREVRTRAPILRVMDTKGKKLSKDQLAYACVVTAFRDLGYTTNYTPGFPSGKFTYSVGKGRKESKYPDGIDPTLPGPQLAAAMNAHVAKREAEIAAENSPPAVPAEKEKES